MRPAKHPDELPQPDFVLASDYKYFQPGPLDPGPWWRRALCAVGLFHRPVGKIRYYKASQTPDIIMYCSRCWRRLS